MAVAEQLSQGPIAHAEHVAHVEIDGPGEGERDESGAEAADHTTQDRIDATGD